MQHRILTWSLIAVSILGTRAARAEVWKIAPGEDNQVKFISTAPLESFEGKTDRIAGAIELDAASVGDSVTVRLEVDLASFDTGIGKRNTHMRENHLETDRFPKATFSGARVISPRAAALETGVPVTFQVEGTMDLHGVTRRLPAEVVVTRTAANDLLVEARFQVHLADYEISRPKFLFLKLNEIQTVEVSATARPE
jgi:polyisoprenoid-binding protein YceI